MAPITIIPKACSCCKGERSSRDKSSNLPLPNILYEGSKGSKDSESSEGCIERCLRWTGLAVGGFLGLTGLWPEGCGGGFAASLLKSALRDWLSVSYGMISILLTGSLRSPPPIRLRRTSPASGGRIKHLEASLRKRLCSKHGLLCPRLRGWQRNWIHRGALRPANPVTCFPPGGKGT